MAAFLFVKDNLYKIIYTIHDIVDCCDICVERRRKSARSTHSVSHSADAVAHSTIRY